jgi:hypothetical protein
MNKNHWKVLLLRRLSQQHPATATPQMEPRQPRAILRHLGEEPFFLVQAELGVHPPPTRPQYTMQQHTRDKKKTMA